MKWIAKKELEIGDKRLRHKFLLFPKNINNEVRWLEKVNYLQKYEIIYSGGSRWYSWVNIKWIEDCKHEWKLIDTHCLGMNPPEQIERFTCSKCGERKTIKNYI